MIWKLVVGWGALLVVFELIRRTLWNSRQGTLQNENNSLNQVATFDTLQSQIERCWLKDIKYENSYLPRFAWKITIHTPDQTVLNPPENATLALRHLFLTLHKLLDGPSQEHQRLETLFTQLFPDPSVEDQVDLANCVYSFLQHAVGTTPSSCLYRLLTSCGQHMIAPAIRQLKAAFSEAQIPFKDVRGGWHIAIHFTADNVTVIHRKREQSYEDLATKRFEFVWELHLRFDRQVQTLQKIDFNIIEVYFPPVMTEMYRAYIHKVMTPFLPHDRVLSLHVLT